MHRNPPKSGQRKNPRNRRYSSLRPPSSRSTGAHQKTIRRIRLNGCRCQEVHVRCPTDRPSSFMTNPPPPHSLPNPLERLPCKSLRHRDTLWNALYPMTAGLNGKIKRIKITVTSMTSRVRGTPIRTKSRKAYRPEPTTRVFTGEETGDMKAAEAAGATVIQNG